MKKKLILNYPNLFLTFLTILNTYLLIYFYRRPNSLELIYNTLALIFLLWSMVAINKFFKLKIANFIFIIYYLHLTINILIGVIFKINDFVPLYHYLSLMITGIIFYIFGLYLIVKIDNIGYLKFSVINFFSLFFAISLTTIIEVLKYLVLKITGIIIFNYVNNINTFIFIIFGAIITSIIAFMDYKYYKSEQLEKILKYF